MEDPPKHNNKEKNNNRKTINIGAGAGSFAGVGGFVLFGGAIVTATLVSAAFAFKNRRKKQSSSSSTKSPTVDSPSDGEEMKSKTIHDSSQDEKHDSGTDNDEKVETVNSNKDQDDPLNFVDSDLESEEADNSYEKIALDSERRVDGDEKVDKESLVASDVVTSMASVTVLPAIRSDGVSSMKETESKTIHDSSPDEKHNSGTDNDEKVETGDSNEDKDSANANFVDSVPESKDVDKSYGYIVLDSEPKDDGDAKEDTESLVSDKTAKSIAEYDTFKEDQMAVEAEETMQYKKGREAAHDEVPLGNNVSEASNEDTPNGHVDEDQETVLTNEEAEAAHVNLVKVGQLLKDEKETDGHIEMVPEDMEDIMEIADHEVAAVVHGTHEDEVIQTSVSNKSPTQSMNEETEQKVEARVTKDDELINNEEKDTEDEIRDLQVIDDLSVERQDNTLARFIDEEETSQNSEQQVTTEDELINKDEKHTEGEEQHVQVFDDLPPKREHDTPSQLINKEEKVKEPMVTKDSLVKEDDQTHVQSIKENEVAKDVTVRSQVTSEGAEQSTQEERTQEEKTGNQNNEDKTEENETILGKEQNDSSHNGIGKEDKDSKSASTHVLDLSKGKIQALASKRWNLKLQTWSALVSVWCLFHWYSELPFPEVSLLCSLMFILILLGYRNRTTNLSQI
nr:pollen Ole e 1 allergen/extensin [Tanacetum cinerariifolium]